MINHEMKRIQEKQVSKYRVAPSKQGDLVPCHGQQDVLALQRGQVVDRARLEKGQTCWYFVDRGPKAAILLNAVTPAIDDCQRQTLSDPYGLSGEKARGLSNRLEKCPSRLVGDRDLCRKV